MTARATATSVELELVDLIRRLGDALEVELEDCPVHEATFHLYACGLVARAREVAL